MTIVARACALAALAALALAAPARGDEAAAWAALKAGGHVLLVRHAQTSSGVGDPPGFRLDDCSTQRNLSDAGRAQSRQFGQRLREAGVHPSEVLSSRWCRCIETARLAFDRVDAWPPLDSLFGNRPAEVQQSAEVRERIRGWKGPGTLVLVTHGANISALTGEGTAMAEALVLAPAAAGFTVVGRLTF